MNDLGAIEHNVESEMALAEASRSDGPATAADAGLPFDAAAVVAYEVRLRGLGDAVAAMAVMGSHEISPATPM